MSVIDSAPATVLIEAARALAPRIRASADDIEQARRLPDWLVHELRDAGFFRMYLPRPLGGLEVDPLTMMRAVEELACADGSTGWCVMIANQNAYFTTSVEAETAAEIGGPNTIIAASGKAAGRAIVADGGYRVSGRWPYASGVAHATWVFANCEVYDGETPRVGENGRPVTRAVWLPASSIEVLDTWRTTGLRGTGSHDFVATDGFVPECRTFRFFLEPPRFPSPLYRVPALMWSLQGGHALGIARRAVEALIELAAGKTPAFSSSVLREQQHTQEQVGRATALIASARLLLEDVTRDLWETLLADAEPTMEQRARVRLAASHAASSARDAVELMYRTGDSSSIHTALPLDRCWRDVTTAATHVAVRNRGFLAAGRLSLGLDLDATTAFGI
jgi:alkylation response protein AidB-like acyl-CoA dehydrogenase